MSVLDRLPQLLDRQVVFALALGIVGVLFVFIKACGKGATKKVDERKPSSIKPPSKSKEKTDSKNEESKTFTKAELLKYRGEGGAKTYIAVKKIVFDVSTNEMYAPGGSYHVFTGHDASRALAKMSLKPEDVDNDNLKDLSLSERDTLDEWFAKFDTKYERVGKMAL